MAGRHADFRNVPLAAVRRATISAILNFIEAHATNPFKKQDSYYRGVLDKLVQHQMRNLAHRLH